MYSRSGFAEFPGGGDIMDRYSQECPFCKGTDFIEGQQNAYAKVAGEGLHATELYHTICRNCGSVVRSYVKSPESLLKRKNRRGQK